jgi:hypothetical protein
MDSACVGKKGGDGAGNAEKDKPEVTHHTAATQCEVAFAPSRRPKAESELKRRVHRSAEGAAS